VPKHSLKVTEFFRPLVRAEWRCECSMYPILRKLLRARG
jgi:hypothetical protein